MSKDTLINLVNFAYKGYAEVNDDNVRSLLQVGQKYHIWQLIKFCVGFLLNLNYENAIHRFLLSIELLCQDVTKEILRFIVQNFAEVMADGRWKQCTSAVLVTFLQNDYLHLSEESLYEILCHWLIECESNGQGLAQVENIRNLFKHIRWTQMDPEYFRANIESSVHMTSNTCSNIQKETKNSKIVARITAVHRTHRKSAHKEQVLGNDRYFEHVKSYFNQPIAG